MQLAKKVTHIQTAYQVVRDSFVVSCGLINSFHVCVTVKKWSEFILHREKVVTSLFFLLVKNKKQKSWAWLVFAIDRDTYRKTKLTHWHIGCFLLYLFTAWAYYLIETQENGPSVCSGQMCEYDSPGLRGRRVAFQERIYFTLCFLNGVYYSILKG